LPLADAEHGNAEGQEMLQQISVIAGQLDREAIGPQAEPVLDHIAVGLGVGDPGGREGGKIGIFCEYMLRAYIFPELHQEAGAADLHVEGKVLLHRV
jgi:hypothetical protein